MKQHYLTFKNITFFSFLNLVLCANNLLAQNEIFKLTFDSTTKSVEGEETYYKNLYNNENELYYGGNTDTCMYVGSGVMLAYDGPSNISEYQGTMEVWLKPNNWVGNKSYTILEYGYSGGMVFVKDGANNLRLIMNRYSDNNQPEIDVAYNQSWDSGTWYHVAFTWGSDTLKLYVNGQLVDYDVYGYTFPAISFGSLNVGHDGSEGGLYAEAFMDELIIYDTVKTAAQINATYLSTKNLNPDPTPTSIPLPKPMPTNQPVNYNCLVPILYLSFDNHLKGGEGELPITDDNITYAAGFKNECVEFAPITNLKYPKINNFHEYEGTLEFWVNPSGNWNWEEEYTILEIGGAGGMIFEKDGANNLRCIINRFSINNQPELDVAYNVFSWDMSQWYFVTYTWGGGYMNLYVNGQLVDTDYYGGSYNFPAINATSLRIGDDDIHGEGPLRAKLDELCIFNCMMDPYTVLQRYTYPDLFPNPTIIDTTLITVPGEVKVEAFPNPTTDVASFDFSEYPPINFIIQITDQKGNVLITAETKGESSVFVDVKSLENGFYYSKILYEDNLLFTGKLVISEKYK